MSQEVFGKYVSVLQEDKEKEGSYKRYPVRFIFLPDTQFYEKLISHLANNGSEVVELSSLLKRDDGWIDYSMLFDIIKSFDKNKDYTVVGFSEVVRFYKKSELETLIVSLLSDLENLGGGSNRRIYILCLGLYDLIYKISNEKHNRLKVYNPVIFPGVLQSETNINLYFTEVENLNELTKVQIKTVREWLNIWTKGNQISSPLICTSRTLNYWYSNAKPDNVFLIQKLDNEKEILKKILNFDFPFSYKADERKFWSNLLVDAYENPEKSPIELISSILNIHNLANVSLTDVWLLNNDTYKRWLIKLLVEHYSNLLGIDDYHKTVIEKLKTFENEEYIRMAWMTIFGTEQDSDDWFRQRKKLLMQINSHNINHLIFEDELNLILNGINDIELLKKLLTDITSAEKKKIIKLFAESFINESEVKELYPSFYSYIKGTVNYDNINNVQWIMSYISKYKNAKIHNDFTDELKDAINRCNGNSEKFYKWYFRLQYVNEILKNEHYDRIIFLDGVGIEWAEVVANAINNKKYFIKRAFIAKSELPSITECNKLDDGNPQPIQNFDKEVIHGSYYLWPDKLIEAIDFINKIINNQIFLKENETVAIISDHGSTCTHCLAKDTKIYNYEKAEHGGRCMVWDQGIVENEDYLVYNNKNQEKWVVPLNHISLKNRSPYEVHGGATPEEVIIPIFLVSKRKSKDEVKIKNYEIEAINCKITGLNRKVSFKITPTPHMKPVLIDETQKEYQLNETNGLWETELTKVKKQNVTIVIGTQKKNFVIKTSFEEGDLF